MESKGVQNKRKHNVSEIKTKQNDMTVLFKSTRIKTKHDEMQYNVVDLLQIAQPKTHQCKVAT